MRIEEWAAALEKAQNEFTFDCDANTSLAQILTEPFEIDSWEAFQDWEKRFPRNCCFRGQRKFEWGLQSTLERTVEQYNGYAKLGRSRLSMPTIQNQLIAAFQRAAHLYTKDLPTSNQPEDWLALMQHHGCPTKLLDWTYSPYVALYFAIFEKSDEDGALWAINLDWLSTVHDILCKLPPQNLLSTNEIRRHHCIREAYVRQQNHRIVSQRGVLLFTYDVGAITDIDHYPFGKCLLSVLLTPEVSAKESQVMSKICVKKRARLELLEELNRVNVNHATLFPTLDGFARSLGVRVEYGDLFS